MKRLFRRDGLTDLKAIGWNVGLMCVGSVLTGVGINGILVPHRFVSGGVTGLSLYCRQSIYTNKEGNALP